MNLYLLILISFIFLCNYFFKKKKLISNYSGNNHQLFSNQKNIPLSGSLYLLVGLFFLLYRENLELSLIIFIIFLLGFLSDIKVLSSPRKRFLLQILLIFFSVNILNLQITSTRIIYLDHLLQNTWFNYLFVTFCILILLNGTNFIDGLNGLVLGYYLIILIILQKMQLTSEILDSNDIFINLIILFIILFLFNLFNQFFLGDGGAYIVAIFFGILLINLNKISSQMSPFFIVLLLWYPCFELLFSMLRKLRFNKSPILPDIKHFHQLLFYFVIKKTKKNKIFCNSLSGFFINCYNLIIFFIASNSPNNSQLQIFLILVSIILYIFIYLKLFDFKYKFY